MKHIALTIALMFGSSAIAHEMPAKHGGVVTEAGSFHVEVVFKDKAVEAYITDHSNKPVPAAGMKATVIMVVDGKPLRVMLSPASENRLDGMSDVAVPSGTKGAIQLQSAGGRSAQGKF